MHFHIGGAFGWLNAASIMHTWADLILLFPLLPLLRTDRTEIKCAGASVLAHSGYSVFQGGVDRTVTCPVPKQDGGARPTKY